MTTLERSTRGQIDIPAARGRLASLCLGSLSVIALMGWLLSLHSENGRYGVAPGSLDGFGLIVAGVFLGLGAVTTVPTLLRSGPTVSIGPRGVFDRNLSRDWIPWDAIRDVGTRQVGREAWVTLVLEPAREASLGLRPRARLIARINSGREGRRYLIAASFLKGGLNALASAIATTRPR